MSYLNPRIGCDPSDCYRVNRGMDCEDCTKAQSTEADCNNDSDDSNITSFPAG